LRQFDGRSQPGYARADDQEIRIHAQTSDSSIRAWYNSFMPSFAVKTPQRDYFAHVERGILERAAEFVPERAGRIFVLSTEDVWKLHGHKLTHGLRGAPHEILILPGGEERKRMNQIEMLAEEMVGKKADRSSVLIAFGGGIATDMGGFLAAIFMRGIPVIQIPTTLLAQVDAAIGGKTGVNLVAGKNLIGSFHQPLAVLIDPGVLDTLPDREYRAGLFEVIKCGVIRSAPLFRLLDERQSDVLAKRADVVDHLIAESVRIKAEVVSADERESGVRRILNFGHTFGHALEAETLYARYLHGEAVGFGMRAAAHLAEATGRLTAVDSVQIRAAIEKYGPIPAANGISAERLAARLGSDKKTIQGKVHFVLPERIGEVAVVSGIDGEAVLQAIQAALA
jgi:3-dehydroquinate synthase